MEARRNVVLTGFMGTGKSTVGRLLAAELDFDFVDTDTIIEERHGPIHVIFAEQGEPAFRAIERAVAAELADREQLVIATGGRMMLDPANVASLSTNSRVFCLVATPEEILERVTADAARVERPLLAVPDPRQRVIDLLAERSPEYRRFAQVATDARSPETIANELAVLVRAEPDRLSLATPVGRSDVIVGLALLPMVRHLAEIEGPLVIVTDDETARLHLASCSTPDLVITLRPRPDRGAALDEARTVAEAATVIERLRTADLAQPATLVSLGDAGVAMIAAMAAAANDPVLDLVCCPTDLATMFDPGIGAAVRLGLQPKAVVADVATLQSQPPRQFAAAMAEVVALALLAGSPLLATIETGVWLDADQRPLPGTLHDRSSLVTQALGVKLAAAESVAADDQPEALLLVRALAESLEQIDSTGWVHGEALGLALVAAARLSATLGRSDPEFPRLVEGLVAHVGLPTCFPHHLDLATIDDAVGRVDEAHRDARPVVMLQAVGVSAVSDGVPHAAIVEALDSLQPASAN